MKYQDYLDDRDEVTRPRKRADKPPIKKANHKHEYTLMEKRTTGYMNPEIGYFTCMHCEKNVTRYL